MKRTRKILLGAVATIVVLGIGCSIFHHYALRHAGEGIDELVQFTATRIKELTRPFVEADALLRYDHKDSRFILCPTAKPDQTATLTEAELPDYIRSAMPPQPKLVVFYRQAEFSTPTERASFESRIRASLLRGGAASVTFAVEQPSTAKSLLE